LPKLAAPREKIINCCHFRLSQFVWICASPFVFLEAIDAHGVRMLQRHSRDLFQLLA
jgi:hypothetical protein